ncbi:MAG TPA: nucleotidyltransferase domain-containing protein [Mobilitalea sp.]|nr:nucleotidyltransferase domain-containing protein [Mobilitalea sp.]
MYEHHKIAIQNLVDYYRSQEGVIAIILGGSVAKGTERIDSDIDATIVVTEERYQELKARNGLADVVSGHCSYEGGYFDIKYESKSFLLEMAEKGSEPCRSSYISAKCLYSTDPEIQELVERIPVFQSKEKENKLFSFYSAFDLSFGYIWSTAAADNPYYKIRTAADIIYYGYRILLQENEVLFPSHRRLEETVARLNKKPDGIIEKAHRFLSELSDESKDDFVNSIRTFMSYTPPEDFWETLTRYIDDNQHWWHTNAPVLTEW